MRILQKTKDGGPESNVDAYFLFESKRFGSVALLRFNKGCRAAYHTHAFNALTWFLKGNMVEEPRNKRRVRYFRSWFPKVTKREDNHRVLVAETSWAFTIRGSWKNTWTEDTPEGKHTVFTHGRKEMKK